MREKIYFLAKGNFSYEPPALVITPSEVELDVVTGTTASTTFQVSNTRLTKLKGFGFFLGSVFICTSCNFCYNK